MLVHVAVRQLFFAGCPDTGDLHIEMECLPCQRMVGIDRDLVAVDLLHHDAPQACCLMISSLGGG